MFDKLGQCIKRRYSFLRLCRFIFFLFHIYFRVPQIIMNVVNSNTMNKPFDFITTSFAANLSDTYSISIRQLPGGYSFYITDNNNISVAIKYINTEHITPQLLKEEPLLQLNYHSATYIGYGPFALIPKTLVIDENYTAFLPLENNLRQRAKTIVNPLTNDILIAAYSNQWTIPNIKCRKYHEVELLATMALNSHSTNSMWTEITPQHINIIVIHDHKLQLANSYPISCDNDAAYYILACYQQLNLPQEEVELNIIGNLLTINPIPFLTDYIRHINTPQPQNWNAELPNQYAPLFTLQTKL